MVGWLVTPQAGRSRILFLVRSLDLSIWRNLALWLPIPDVYSLAYIHEVIKRINSWFQSFQIACFKTPPKLNGRQQISLTDDFTWLTKGLQGFNFNRFYWMGRWRSLEAKVILIFNWLQKIIKGQSIINDALNLKNCVDVLSSRLLSKILKNIIFLHRWEDFS